MCSTDRINYTCPTVDGIFENLHTGMAEAFQEACEAAAERLKEEVTYPFRGALNEACDELSDAQSDLEDARTEIEALESEVERLTAENKDLQEQVSHLRLLLGLKQAAQTDLFLPTLTQKQHDYQDSNILPS